MQRNIKTLAPLSRLAAFCLILLLAGCMGDESSSSSAPSGEIFLQSELDLSPVVMASEDVLIRDLRQLLDSGSKNIALTVETADDFIWGSYSQGLLTLETALVDSLRHSTITLRLADSGDVIGQFSVSVNPPAATAEIATEAEHLLAQQQQLITLAEPEVLYQHLLQLAYWGGKITHEEQQQHLAQWSPDTASSSAPLADSLDQLYGVKESYRTGGGASGDDLRAALDHTYALLQRHVGYAEQQIDKVYALAADVLPEHPQLVYRYSPFTGTVSALQGSSHSGYWEDEQWVFHSWMAYLEIVTNKFHNRPCNLS